MPRSTNVVASRAWHSRQVLPIDLSSDVAGEHVPFLIIDLPCKTAVNRALNLLMILIQNCSRVALGSMLSFDAIVTASA
jgi:hypothetical protein